MHGIQGAVVKAGAVAIALALSGCGGGGGDSAGANPPVSVSPAPQRIVQGTAAKGLIKGAKVSVYEIDAQGVRAAAALATGTTGTNGGYKLQIPASVRNFVIVVSAAQGAVMADEVSGTDLPIPDSMTLRSVVTLAEAATGAYEGSVTPLTEMIVRTAETADGKLTQQAVAQAKVNVRTMLGFDPETVKPVNSNSAAAASASEDEKNQSLALAAISKMGNTVSADCAQSTPGERISCVVGKLASSVTLKDGQPGLEQTRLAQFREAVQTVALDQNVNRTGKVKVVGIPVLTPAPTTGVTDPTTPTAPTTPTTPTNPANPEPAPTTPTTPSTPEPVPTTPTTPTTPATPPVGATPTQLEATKVLFGSLRTNLNVLGAADGFRATADAVKADLNNNILPLGNDARDLATLAVSAVDLLDQIRASRNWFKTYGRVVNNVVTISPVPYNIANGDGGCAIVVNPLSLTCTVVRNNYLPGSVATSFTAGTQVYATRVFKIEPKAGSTTDYTYSAWFERNTARYEGWTIVGEPVKETIGTTQTGTLTLARGANLMQLAVNGRLPGRLNAGGALDSDFEDWKLDVTRTEEAGGLALYKFGGEFSATKAGQPAGKVSIANTSFLRMALPQDSSKVAVNEANELEVTLNGTVGNTRVSGTLRAAGDKLDKSQTKRMPTNVLFEGWLEHQGEIAFSGSAGLTRLDYDKFDASIPESDSNFALDIMEIRGVLTLPNRPRFGLVLGATRTGADSANINAQYRDGTSVINAKVSARVGERHPLVKVSSAEGVAFSFTDTSSPVPVTKDGAVVAQLDLAKGIITYSDGSTESLK
ncbi:hypothetical protein LK540_05335 [Massilia sp. IC2-278]|uniref:hypothetical protein n=1 Tax=Massilia sp. IC2-278 TaxID=2887200 RepID=UPI001E602C48|nr:hypothetical protein [Massilia sp. IC2-278]MCC2959849.1 hypothetical protein [Massilia sp. IC2-278]